MSKRGEWDQMAGLISDDVLAEVAVIAPPDRLGEAIRRRYGDRVQRVGFYLVGGVKWSDEEEQALVAATK
jgi:erythromycin esterase-like protein